MALKTKQQYIDSLRKLKPTVYMFGEKIENPVDNPRITVVVIVDEPATMSYGGQSAAPAFSRISQQVLNYMNVAPRVQLAAEAGPRQAAAYTKILADRSG